MAGMQSARWWLAALLALGLGPAAGWATLGDQKPEPGPVAPKFSEGKFVSGGQDIKVWCWVPGEGKGPFPGIVLLHGIDGLDMLKTDIKIGLLYRTIGSKLAQQGFVVHFVHYFNRTPLKKNEIADVKNAFFRQAQDKKDNKDTPLDPKLQQYYKDWMVTVRDGVEYLRQEKGVDKDRIGIVGLSMGGFLASSAAVEYPELKLSALANIFGGLPTAQHAKVRKDKMKLPPLLLMAAEKDDVVPEIFQRELFQLWRDTGNHADAHFYGGVGHAFYNEKLKTYDADMALNDALPTAQHFLKRHLQPAPVKK